MSTFIQRGCVLPGSLLPLRTERAKGQPWVELGFPGLDPAAPTLYLAVFDDSGSVTSPHGTDPVGNRYAEARQAIKLVAAWTVTARAKIAILHFDHPHGASGVQQLNSRALGANLTRSLRTPPNGAGTSDLQPSLMAAETLARTYEDHEVVLTVFSDFQITDDDPDTLFTRLRDFPGEVHAVVLGEAIPEPLQGGEITVTTLTQNDPSGSFAAALHRSLIAGRRGARHSVLHLPKHPKRTGRWPA